MTIVHLLQRLQIGESTRTDFVKMRNIMKEYLNDECDEMDHTYSPYVKYGYCRYCCKSKHGDLDWVMKRPFTHQINSLHDT